MIMLLRLVGAFIYGVAQALACVALLWLLIKSGVI
jgi:hypothetical protein